MRIDGFKRAFTGILLLSYPILMSDRIPVGAQERSPAPKVDIQRLGPQVGDRAPDFQLQDQSGKTWTLDSLSGTKGTMLVFYRSADW
jgi:hypothetical protein